MAKASSRPSEQVGEVEVKLHTTREERERFATEKEYYPHFFNRSDGSFYEVLAWQVAQDANILEDELASVREQLADTQKRFAEYMAKSFPVEINVDGKMYSPKLLAESDKLRAELAIVSVQHQQSLKTRDELRAELEAANSLNKVHMDVRTELVDDVFKLRAELESARRVIGEAKRVCADEADCPELEDLIAAYERFGGRDSVPEREEKP